MLVKIKPGVFINPDHVSGIVLLADGNYAVNMIHQIIDSPWTIPAQAAAYLMDVMETQSAVVLPGEPDYVDLNCNTLSTQPLTSRVAQLLRDEYVEGTTKQKLAFILSTRDFPVTLFMVQQALDALLTEGVILYINPTYYHATHRPNKPALEPLPFLADEPPPFDTMIRDGKMQCVECGVQSCLQCFFLKACCKCNCPSFTAYVSNENNDSSLFIDGYRQPRKDAETVAKGRQDLESGVACASSYPYQCVNAGCDQQYSTINEALSCVFTDRHVFTPSHDPLIAATLNPSIAKTKQDAQRDLLPIEITIESYLKDSPDGAEISDGTDRWRLLIAPQGETVHEGNITGWRRLFKFTPNHDPLIASAASASRPAEDTGKKEDLTNFD